MQKRVFDFSRPSDPVLSQVQMDAVTHQTTFAAPALLAKPRSFIFQTPMLRRTHWIMQDAIAVCCHVLDILGLKDASIEQTYTNAKKLNPNTVAQSFLNATQSPQELVTAYEAFLEAVHNANCARTDLSTDVCLALLRAAEAHVQTFGPRTLGTPEQLKQMKLADLEALVSEPHEGDSRTVWREQIFRYKEDLIVMHGMTLEELNVLVNLRANRNS
jgi:hypothetical protein